MAYDIAAENRVFPSQMAPQKYNLIADTDSYKLGHWLVYREIGRAHV